jgi:hypothetical protein
MAAVFHPLRYRSEQRYSLGLRAVIGWSLYGVWTRKSGNLRDGLIRIRNQKHVYAYPVYIQECKFNIQLLYWDISMSFLVGCPSSGEEGHACKPCNCVIVCLVLMLYYSGYKFAQLEMSKATFPSLEIIEILILVFS